MVSAKAFTDDGKQRAMLDVLLGIKRSTENRRSTGKGEYARGNKIDKEPLRLPASGKVKKITMYQHGAIEASLCSRNIQIIGIVKIICHGVLIWQHNLYQAFRVRIGNRFQHYRIDQTKDRRDGEARRLQ